MSLLPIIEVPDPLLRSTSAPVERIDDDLKRLIGNMFETMYEAPGIGLAGIQVGVSRRLLVIDLQELHRSLGDDAHEGGADLWRETVLASPCLFQPRAALRRILRHLVEDLLVPGEPLVELRYVRVEARHLLVDHVVD